MMPVRTRRTMDIGEVIPNGVVFDLKNWQRGTVDAARLPQAVTRLLELLEKRFEGLRVKLPLTRRALFRRVSEKYSAPRPFEGLVVRCAAVKGLLLLKLFALPSLYRQGDGDRLLCVKRMFLCSCGGFLCLWARCLTS